jgi:hypothetical protein
MTPRTTIAPWILTALLLGCGGQTIRLTEDGEASADADDEATAEATSGDDDEDEDEDEAGLAYPEGEGSEEAVASGGGDAAPPPDDPIVLGALRAVPGTGVQVRAPEGAERIPYGSGFLDRRYQVQLVVVVGLGPESILDLMRSAGGQGGAPTPEEVRRVQVDGVDGRIGYDRVESVMGSLERTWVLAHDGTTGLGVIATYPSGMAELVREPLLESLEDVTWNRDSPIDAGAALGLEVGEHPGMEDAHASNASLVYIPTGASYPTEIDVATLNIAPLPLQIPEDQAAQVCRQYLSQIIRVAELDIEEEDMIRDGRLPGCERLATVETADGALSAYAALLFHGSMPILVTGRVDAEQIDQWRGRFATAARSVSVRE